MNHLMVDLETMGNGPYAPVISIGVKWSTKTGHRVRVFPVSIFRFVWG
ncbi:3'-5' exoribonuclease domain-containing protein [Escherichia sp. MOD1-EC5948]